MKVVINKCFGGFGLSHAATLRYAEISGFALYPYMDRIARQVYGPEKAHECDHKSYAKAPVEIDEYGFIRGDEYPQVEHWYDGDLSRTDQVLVRVVEEMGSPAASGNYAKLAVVEIPDGTDYEISEYDGREHIAEKHQTWG